MQKPRTHERATFLADVTIGPGEERPARFAAKMFNVSRGGAAVFSKQHFPVGKLVAMELPLPERSASKPKVMLYGVIRRVTVRTDGNVLGIEFVAGAADYGRFMRYLDPCDLRLQAARRGGFTLVEACLAVVIICVLVTMAAPVYTQAIEQARVDGAARNLRAIWSAQRVYWLEDHTFATGLAALGSKDLVDGHLVESASRPDAVFAYTITTADEATFTATAQRRGSSIWLGQLVIDETGEVTGVINGPGGAVIAPPP